MDNDIIEYEVFFGTTPTPTTSIGTVADDSLSDVAVASGNTYYWKVITEDSIGNTSESEVFQFRVL